MEIKSYRLNKNFKKNINSFILYFKNNFIILNLIYLSIFLFILAILLNSTSSYYNFQKAKILFINNKQIFLNYISSLNADVSKIYLNVQDLDLKKIEFQKKKLNDLYIQDPLSVNSFKRNWISASIDYKGKSYKAKIRIKGQGTDHWGRYSSFKVKLKDQETVLGMKRFSLQHPARRGYLNELIFNEFLKYNDLIYLRYNFIRLYINGDKYPIYAIEENFEKRLIENNQRKEGLIFKINNQNSNLITIQQSNSEMNPDLYDQFKFVKNNIDALFNNRIILENVFDIDKISKYYALLDLFGYKHSSQSHNLRFYFNPSTALIEPIGYDQHYFFPAQYSGLFNVTSNIDFSDNNTTNLFNKFINNKIFYGSYIENLEKISEKKYLDVFFNEINTKLKKKIKIIYKSEPYFEFRSNYQYPFWQWHNHQYVKSPYGIFLPRDKFILYENQKYIKNYLKLNSNLIQIFYQQSLNEDKSISLKLFNFTNLPIQILKIYEKNNIAINSDYIDMPPQNNKYIIHKIKNKQKIDYYNKEIFADVKILGSKKTYKINIEKEIIQTNKDAKIINNYQYDFINLDNENKIIKFNQGIHTIDETIVFPSNYKIIIFENTKINLVKNSKIISFSPIDILGTRKKPVEIFSSDKTGSLAIIKANNLSRFVNVNFFGLSNINLFGYQLSGGINFYESNIEINNCQFKYINSEDAINIVRSDFNINNCNFIKSSSDSIDIDYSKGKIQNSSFVDSGNDGIDISGSNIDLTNITINNSGDKGLSIGEKSNVNINLIVINKAKIGIAVKDKSIVYLNKKEKSTLDSLIINDCEIGLAIYQKKSEFGPAELHIGSESESYDKILYKNTKTHFIVEEGSFLRIGFKIVNKFTKDVFKLIYG